MLDNLRGHFRSPSVLLRDYSTRVLLGFLGSLGILLLLLHLPLAPGSEPVGWSLRAPDQIPISEIERSEDGNEKGSAEERTSELEEPPPPTHQAPPVEQSQTKSWDGSGTNPGETVGSDDQAPNPSKEETVPIAKLASNDHKPELIGGKGSLYLQINYPYKARRNGIEGRLKVRFTVTRTGGVRRIKVEKPLHPLCDSAAVRAIRSVRFRPAKRQGDPVPVRMTLPIRFELEKPDTSSLHTTRRGTGR